MISTELNNAITNLRHLYANMQRGVKDSANAKRLAEGLLAPTIERLERISDKLTKESEVKS